MSDNLDSWRRSNGSPALIGRNGDIPENERYFAYNAPTKAGLPFAPGVEVRSKIAGEAPLTRSWDNHFWIPLQSTGPPKHISMAFYKNMPLDAEAIFSCHGNLAERRFITDLPPLPWEHIRIWSYQEIQMAADELRSQDRDAAQAVSCVGAFDAIYLYHYFDEFDVYRNGFFNLMCVLLQLSDENSKRGASPRCVAACIVAWFKAWSKGSAADGSDPGLEDLGRDPSPAQREHLGGGNLIPPA